MEVSKTIYITGSYFKYLTIDIAYRTVIKYKKWKLHYPYLAP